ncbi:MAG TPA: hypothetical protein PLX62_12455, partial [Bacteroidales bacterium]|nr:hypothetical protein [Bacteroidales bacterium]
DTEGHTGIHRVFLLVQVAVMADEPKIKAQVIKAQTMTDGALRIYLDVFNSDDMSIAYLTLLAKDQAVIEFEPKKAQ